MADIELQASIIRISSALLAGCLLGLEREIQRKAAGIRTITLICVSSTLFTILSVHIAGPASTDRIASNILTGVGFIGAGVIFRGGFTIDGITTAAVIWISAAIGMAMGIDEYGVGWFTVLVALLVLWGLVLVEKVIVGARQRKYYAIRYREDQLTPLGIEQMFRDHKLLIKKISVVKTRDTAIGSNILEGKYELTGSGARMEAMNNALLSHSGVLNFDVELAT